MDPQACLRLIQDALDAKRRPDATLADKIAAGREAKEARANLWSWLRSGGFAPDWSQVRPDTRRFIGCGF